MNLVIRSRPLALVLAAALVAPATASTAHATSTATTSALPASPAETASTAASSSPTNASAPIGAQPKSRVRARDVGSGYRFVRQASAERGLASGIGVRRRCGCVGPTSYGKEHDELTSLSYYGYRFYDRLTLTWTQADPLFRFVPDLAWDEPRRANLYSFSLNNPLRYIDPDGRDRDTDADARVNRQIEQKRQEDEEERRRKEEEKYEKDCVDTPIAAGDCPSVQARSTFTGDIGPDVHEDVMQEARNELAADLSHRYATVAAVALSIADGAALVGVLRGVGRKLLGRGVAEGGAKTIGREATAAELAAARGAAAKPSLRVAVGEHAARVVRDVLKGKQPVGALTAEQRAAAAGYYRDVAARTTGAQAAAASRYNIARAEYLEGVREVISPTLPQFIKNGF